MENKSEVLFVHTVCAQHNNRLTAFRRAALRPITQNAVGDHICHFVIDRLLLALQPSHRAVKEPFNMQHSAQNMDQQRHLVSRGVPRPGGIHQSETTVLWTQKVPPHHRLYNPCIYRVFNINKAELRKMFSTTSVTIQSDLFHSGPQPADMLTVVLSWPRRALLIQETTTALIFMHNNY